MTLPAFFSFWRNADEGLEMAVRKPAKNAQKDKDARWTKKNDASFYGYIDC